jgi:hypothetical protein
MRRKGIGAGGDETGPVRLLHPGPGGEAGGIFRAILKGGDEEIGGAVEALDVQGEQHVTARGLHGKMDGLGLEIRGQSETEAEVGIAVIGGGQPRYLGILLGLCQRPGTEDAEAGEEGKNLRCPW